MLKIKIIDYLSKQNEKEELKKLYEKLSKDIELGKVELDFESVNLLTTAILNDTIGKLILNKNLDLIMNNLDLINIKDDDAELLKIVIETALEMKDKTKKN